MYQFTSKRFKTRSEQDAAKAEQQAKLGTSEITCVHQIANLYLHCRAAEEKAREMEDAARYVHTLQIHFQCQYKTYGLC